jgi:quercetin dioxygenase-like cupin family protein
MNAFRAATIALLALATQPGRAQTRTLLQATTTVNGEPLLFPTRANLVTATITTLQASGQTGNYAPASPAAVYVLGGALTLTVMGLPPRTIRTGEAYIAPNRVAMNLTNRGSGAARFLTVYFGAEGQPLNKSGTGEPRGLQAEMVLQTTTTWAGEPILFPVGANQLSVLTSSVAPKGSIARHTHAHTQFVYVLDGEHSVQPAGRPARAFRAGEAMVETTQPHTGANPRTSADRFVTVFAGKAGVPLSTPAH